MAVYTGELIKQNFVVKSADSATVIDCEYIDETNGGLLLDLVKHILGLAAHGRKIVITGSTPGLRKVILRLCYMAEIEFCE